MAQAEAQAAAQRQAVQGCGTATARKRSPRHGPRPPNARSSRRLRNGGRPEEIAQARADVESAKADALNARQRYDRVRGLPCRP